MKVDHLSDAELALRPHRVTGPVMDAFLEAAAIHPSRALAYRPPGPAEQKEVARLAAARVLVPVAGGRHWFDLRRHYTVRRASEVRWMVGSVIGALIGAAIVVQFYMG